jgi:hypothetical protein
MQASDLIVHLKIINMGACIGRSCIVNDIVTFWGKQMMLLSVTKMMTLYYKHPFLSNKHFFWRIIYTVVIFDGRNI